MRKPQPQSQRRQTSDWTSAKPETAGFAPDLGVRLAAGIRSGLLRGLHGLVVSRGDAIILERNYEGVDEAWGRPLGPVKFTRSHLHDLRSVTKSIVSLLYGIALDRGLVPEPAAALLAQFPEYTDLVADPARMKLTIAQALTMTLGLEWDEQRPYSDPANSEIAMERAADRYRFALDRPIVAGTGRTLDLFGRRGGADRRHHCQGQRQGACRFRRKRHSSRRSASTVLTWARGRDGIASAASGLRLKPRDLLKIGRVVLGKGLYRGRRIVSESWIAKSFTPSAATGDGLEYGYLWFLGQATAPAFQKPMPWAGGFGNGGQRLWLMPEADHRLRHHFGELQPARFLGHADAHLAGDYRGKSCTRLTASGLIALLL